MGEIELKKGGDHQAQHLNADGAKKEVATLSLPVGPENEDDSRRLRSVWERIEAYLKPQEVYAVKRLVGDSVIDRNETLWAEREALEDMWEAVQGRFEDRRKPRTSMQWEEKRAKLLLDDMEASILLSAAGRDAASQPLSSRSGASVAQLSVQSAPDALESALNCKAWVKGCPRSTKVLREAILNALQEEATSLEECAADLRDLLDRAADAVLAVQVRQSATSTALPKHSEQQQMRVPKSIRDKLREAVAEARDENYIT